MKNFWLIVFIFCAVKLGIHYFGNQNYGFQRDELLHLSVSEHLDWGFMEFPPFVAVVGKVAHGIFGYSLSGIRLFSTLAGLSIVALCCLMARDLGGEKRAVTLAGFCVLCFLPFYRNHTLLQPVAFDQLFWTLGFFLLIRYIKTNQPKFLLWIGVTAGLGLLNKYTFLVLGVGFVAALILLNRGETFRSKWVYLAGAIALTMILPNIFWQYEHHWPLIQHLEKLNEVQLDRLSPFEFGLAQLSFPITFVVSLFGLFAFFADADLKRYSSVGVMVIVIFATMWIMKSKGYYFFAAYPVLFAAGSVKLEKLIASKRWITYPVIVLLLITSVPFIPDMTPVLPIEKFVVYKKMKPDAEGRYKLTGDYADMFGWDEQVALADSLYRSLSDNEKSRAILWAENYGEAGAIQVLGDRYDLPDPVCRHGSFWLWGPGEKKGEIAISIGNEESSVKRVFAEYELVKMIHHPYAIDEENNIPVYICRKPVIDLKVKWPELEKYVFE